MNEIQQNASRALVFAIAITLPILFLYDYFYQPLKEKFIEENNCFDDNVVCDLFPFHYLFMPIPVIIYYIIFNYLERKRKKTWRSYN